MKIICDNQEEYNRVIEACKYIHDYTVDVYGASKKTKIVIIDRFGIFKPPKKPDWEIIKPEKGSRRITFGLDFEKYPFINMLAHGIADCTEDIRKRFIEIKD